MDHLLAIAALEPGEEPSARETFEDLRKVRYVSNAGKRGIQLDSGEFDRLAEVLYHDCEWEEYEIRSRLKHYEGWDDHDWV